MKKLHDEAAKYRTNAKALAAKLKEYEEAGGDHKTRADTAEANIKVLSEALRDAQKLNGFLFAANGKVTDLEQAWKLADHASVKVSEDGKVEGLDEVVKATLKRYPHLAPKPGDEVDPRLLDKFPALGSNSGSPNNGRRKGTDMATPEALRAKFPALRSR